MSYYSEQLHGYGIDIEKLELPDKMREALNEHADELYMPIDNNPTFCAYIEWGTTIYYIPDIPAVIDPKNPIGCEFTQRMTEKKANQYIADRIIHDLKELDTSKSFYGMSTAETQKFCDELPLRIAANAERCPTNVCWTIN